MVGRLIVEHDRLTTPNRETPAPEKPPAGAGIPVGKADIVGQLRGTWIWSNDRDERLRNEAADEITRLRGEAEDAARKHASDLRLAVLAERARHFDVKTRLRAEVERLTAERDAARDAGGDARISENKAEHARVSMSLRATKLEADRAALATRVAEAVREACKQAVIGTYGDARNHHRMDAIDLGPVVAAALKESAP
jgi:hypothetical protein